MSININVHMNIKGSFIWKFLYLYEDMYQLDEYSYDRWYKCLYEHLDEHTMILYMKISIIFIYGDMYQLDKYSYSLSLVTIG